MKKVAILTDSFLSWGGGVDFIKNIILALCSLSKDVEIDIYIFLKIPETELNYRNYPRLRRLYYNVRTKLRSSYRLTDSDHLFPEFLGCKFVYYHENCLHAVIKYLKIGVIMPHFDPNLFKLEIPSIGYLYDCQHNYYPDFFSDCDIEERNVFFQKMVDSGGKIIVNANSVKNDLVHFFGANAEQISVLPFTPKVKKEYFNNPSTLIDEYNLPFRYFIISNQFWLHKDHRTAFIAFSEFQKLSEYSDIKLVCTGLMKDDRRPNYMDELRSLISDLEIDAKVELLGHIPKMKQLWIMKYSLAVIQPTLFEGGPGGGAVSDGLSLGVPCIVSDILTNLEIIGDNVFYFRAGDPGDLKEKMMAFMNMKIKHPSTEALARKNDENIEKLGLFLFNLINGK